MRESTTVKNRVSVLFYYDGDDDYARPVRLMWRGREYDLGPVKFWHTTNRGSQLQHHYTVSDLENDLTFQLAMETENLTWTLERVSMRDDTVAAMPSRSHQLMGSMA
jgi:hypothetical protein